MVEFARGRPRDDRSLAISRRCEARRRIAERTLSPVELSKVASAGSNTPTARSTPSSPWMRGPPDSGLVTSSRRLCGARTWACSRGCRSASRTCRQPRGSGPPGGRCCSRTTCRPRTSSASPTSARPAASSWPRPTRPSSAPAPTPPIACMAPPAIRSIRRKPAAAPPAARRWRWRCPRCRSRPAPTTAAASGRRQRSAASPASGPRPAWCLAWIGRRASARSA